MNAIKNKVQLIGHLGQVPDVKNIGEGKKSGPPERGYQRDL